MNWNAYAMQGQQTGGNTPAQPYMQIGGNTPPAPAPGVWQNGWGRLRDSIASGNNYNRQTGAFTATPGQWATGIGSRLLGMFNPALGHLAGTAANGYYGQGPMSRMFNRQGNPQGMQLPQANPFTGQAPQSGMNWGQNDNMFSPNTNPFATTPGPYNQTVGVRDRGGGYQGDAARGLFAGLQSQSQWNASPESFGDYAMRDR